MVEKATKKFKPAKPPSERGKPAAVGMVRMLDAAVGDRAKMKSSLLTLYEVDSLAELDQAEVKEVLAEVIRRTKPEATA